MEKNTKLLAAGALGATFLAGGLLTTQVASADTVDDDTTTTTDATSDATTEGDITSAADEGEGRRGRGYRGGPGGCGGGLDAVAEAIGLDAEVLRSGFADGQTLAEIAEENGVDPQVVIDALIAQATERIDAKVADGDLTEDEAAERLAEATDRAEDHVYAEPPAEGERPARGEGRGPYRHGPGADGPATDDADDADGDEETEAS